MSIESSNEAQIEIRYVFYGGVNDTVWRGDEGGRPMQGNCEGAGGALVPHAKEAITDARIPVRWAATVGLPKGESLL